MSDQDPTAILREQTAQIRDALRLLRESVVLRVMHRNKLQEEVERSQQRVSDMERGMALAEQAGSPDMAAQFRQEREARLGELERFRALLAQADADAETAKTNLPEDEANLMRRINDLQAQAARLIAARVEANQPGNPGNSAEDLWQRATGKIADLRHEASARSEVSRRGGSSVGSASNVGNTRQPQSPDADAEQMIAELESRLGITPTLPGARSLPVVPAGQHPTAADYLEFDAPPLASTPQKSIGATSEASNDPADAVMPATNTPPAQEATNTASGTANATTPAPPLPEI